MTDPLACPGPVPPGPFDVLVVGAGAAGLWAAGTAAARGRRVLLLEKNPRVGVKVLASGGTHCNVTTTLEGAALRDAYGREAGRWLAPALRGLGPRDVRAELLALGVPTEEGELEKVWPVSRRARHVAEALLERARRAGAVVRTGVPVLGIERGFRVRTAEGAIDAPRVVVTVGGRSYPRTGTTGDGYGWLTALGHTVVPPVPALAPLVVELDWVRALAGIAVPDACTRVRRGGRVVADRRRPLLFTHTGLSGPGPMDVSRWFEVGDGGAPELLVDFLPDRSADGLRADLLAALSGAGAARRIAAVLPGALPQRLAESLCAAAGVPPAMRAGETSKAQRHGLVQALKRWSPPVSGTRGFDFAEVTAGGVALDELDPATMESRLVPGLFVAGEILDVDGPIGGFNFQSAFSTGHAAGRCA